MKVTNSLFTLLISLSIISAVTVSCGGSRDSGIVTDNSQIEEFSTSPEGEGSDEIDELVAQNRSNCFEESCAVWVLISKSNQTLDLYVYGEWQDQWIVSTGMKGYGTPNFSRHPNGLIYDKYSSKKYPGGDWNGLGNMPYAVFISGGYALHGTPKANWKYLGQKASHGCIRMHPDNGYKFNRLVRDVGAENTWITVEP